MSDTLQQPGIAIVVGVASGVGTALVSDLARFFVRRRNRPRLKPTLRTPPNVRLFVQNDGRTPAEHVQGYIDLPVVVPISGASLVTPPQTYTDEKGVSWNRIFINVDRPIVPGPAYPCVEVLLAGAIPPDDHVCHVRLWSANADRVIETLILGKASDDGVVVNARITTLWVAPLPGPTSVAHLGSSPAQR